jgi:hypothetical protein
MLIHPFYAGSTENLYRDVLAEAVFEYADEPLALIARTR